MNSHYFIWEYAFIYLITNLIVHKIFFSFKVANLLYTYMSRSPRLRESLTQHNIHGNTRNQHACYWSKCDTFQCKNYLLIGVQRRWADLDFWLMHVVMSERTLNSLGGPDHIVIRLHS